MLNQLRSFAATKFTKLLLIILVGSFALWGVGDVIRGGAHADVATYSGGEVTLEEWSIKYNEFASRSRGWFENLSDEEKLEVATAIANQLVINELFNKEIHKLGFTISDDMIHFQIATNPNFQDGGQFSKEKFEAYLKARGFNDASYLEHLRKSMGSMFLERLTNIENAPASLIAAQQTGAKQVKNYQVVTIEGSKLNLKYPEFSEQELQSVYNANKELFATAEKRSYAVLTIAPQDVKVNPEVTAAEIESYYQQERQVLEAMGGNEPSTSIDKLKEKYKSRIIHERQVEEATKLASRITSELAQGKTMEQLSKEHSLKLQVFTDKALNSKDQDIALDVAFGIGENEVSDAINLSSGDVIIVRTNKIQPTSYSDYSSVKAKVVELARNQYRSGKLNSLVATAGQTIKTNAELEAFAKEHQLAVSSLTLPAFTDFAKIENQSKYGLIPYLMKPSEVSKPMQIAPDSFVILSYSGQSEGSEKGKLSSNDINQILQRDLNFELQSRLRSYLARSYDVKINHNLLKNLVIKQQ